MKKIGTLLFLSSTLAFGQLTYEDAKKAAAEYQLGSYSYFENFVGLKDYASSLILTNDGGAAAFGDCANEEYSGGLIVKFDKTGKELWKQIVKLQYDEMECQGVIEDTQGNLFVFMLSYNYEKYRGGSERVVCFDKSGTQLWDKMFGTFNAVNNPIFSYIRALDDGRISFRGHISPTAAEEDKDPVYHYWEGWLTVKGEMTQKTGKVINWATDPWQDWYKPD